jgi:hypothetical protein
VLGLLCVTRRRFAALRSEREAAVLPGARKGLREPQQPAPAAAAPQRAAPSGKAVTWLPRKAAAAAQPPAPATASSGELMPPPQPFVRPGERRGPATPPGSAAEGGPPAGLPAALAEALLAALAGHPHGQPAAGAAPGGAEGGLPLRLLGQPLPPSLEAAAAAGRELPVGSDVLQLLRVQQQLEQQRQALLGAMLEGPAAKRPRLAAHGSDPPRPPGGADVAALLRQLSAPPAPGGGPLQPQPATQAPPPPPGLRQAGRGADTG